MGIVDAIYEGITGRAADAGRSLGDVLARVRAYAGGAAKAAALVGVHPATFRRWQQSARGEGGTRPSARHAVGLESADRRARVGGARERQIRDAGFILSGTQLDQGRQRTRNISASEGAGGMHLAPGTINDVLEAWFEGDDAGAVDILQNGTEDPFYQQYIDWDDSGDIDGEEGYGVSF